MLSYALRQSIKRLALKSGYEVRKAHPESYSGVQVLDVFGLALRELVGRKGKEITFVEIGANDGIEGDYLRPHIERMGLRGILVEPQPSVFEQLKLNYKGIPGVSFENCAIAATEGSLSLYYVDAGEADQKFSKTLTTANRASLENYSKETGGRVVEIKVPCIRPETLLAKHGFSQIDILQIDTEGMDFEILKAFDLQAIAPEIIHYESGQLNPTQQEESYRYLSEQGYQLMTHQGDTLAIPSRD